MWPNPVIKALFNSCTTGECYTLMITCKGPLDFQIEVKLLLSEEVMGIEHTEITTVMTSQMSFKYSFISCLISN